MTEHRVYIRHESSGFDVTVEPPLEGESFDRECSTHRQARGYAGGLRLSRGWKIVDLSAKTEGSGL